jgi:hypothetical protein
MSGTQLPAWALILAAILAPAALHAQAATDSSASSPAQETARPSPAIETGRVNFMARDTSQASITADTTPKARPGAGSEKPKLHRKESDSIRLRGDTATTQSSSPY